MSESLAVKLMAMGYSSETDFEAHLEDDGSTRLKWVSARPQPTMQEIEAAWPAVQAALAAAAADRKAADDQQAAGIVEAKRCDALMQAIIDGVDTATIAQLRLAVKEIARDIQHLIHAAVK